MLVSIITVEGQTTIFKQSYNYTEMLSPIIITPISPIGFSNQDGTVISRKVYLKLDLGEVYPLGGQDWSVILTSNIVPKDGMGTPLNTDLRNFNISDNSGSLGANIEQIVEIDYSVYNPSINSFEIQIAIGNISTSGGLAPSLVTDNLRITVELVDEVKYNHQLAGVEIVPLNLRVYGVGTSIIDNRIVGATFSWDTPSQTHFESYDLEVLKVEPEKIPETATGTVPVDWSKAERVEVDGGGTNYSMTLAMGTGYYLWRVRPIGNFYSGGRSNRLNYGQWTNNSAVSTTPPYNFTSHNYLFTSIFPEVTQVTPNNLLSTAPLFSDYFYYQQFDENLNWSYNKALTENSKQFETMTWANGLNQVKQTQTKQFSNQQVIGQQSAYDYSARPAVSSLPAPLNRNYLGFNPDLFTVAGMQFSAADFDQDGNIYVPPVLGNNDGSINEYYSNNQIGSMKDGYVANANGVPYSRVLFYPDATGRVYKQSNVGDANVLDANDNPLINHNVINKYEGTVSQTELDRLFGSEAPLANSVSKLETQDQNGVATITYTSKNGQVIATSVDNQGELPNLDEIDNLGDDFFDVEKILEPGTTQPGSYVSTSSTSLIVNATNPSGVKDIGVDYSITLNSFNGACGICWTCDYKVEISIAYPLDPTDVKRNVTLTMWILPTDLSPSCTYTPTPMSLSDLTAGGTLFEITGPTTPVWSDLITISAGTVKLPSGSYIITKKVYTNNTNPFTGNQFIEDYVIDDVADDFDANDLNIHSLWEQSQNWTADDNCCGPITIDASGFDCGGTIYDCADLDNVNSVFYALASSWYSYVTTERTAIPAYYAALSPNNSSHLLSFQKIAIYGSLADFINNAIKPMCTAGITSDKMEACFNAFGSMLESNIAKVTPPIPVLPVPQVVDANFDFLRSAFECLGYDPDGENCASFKTVVLYDVSVGSAYNDACSSGEFFICLVELGTTTGTTCPNARYYVIPNTNGTTNDLANARLHCVNSFIYPNPDLGNPVLSSTNNYSLNYAAGLGMSTPAEMENYAQQVCNCIKGVEAGFLTNPSGLPPTNGVVEICEDACSSKIGAFELAIDQYVLDYNHALGVLTDEVDGLGVSIWDNNDPPAELWASFEDLMPNESKTCYIDAMYHQCVSQCQLIESLSATSYISNPNPVTGPSGIVYPTGLDFVSSPEFTEIAQQENQAYTEAYTYNAEFAPVGSYSNIPDPDAIEKTLIEFFYSSLDNMMTQKANFNGGNPSPINSATPDYPISWYFPGSSTHWYAQNEFIFNYRLPGASGIKEVVGVTNVVWEPNSTPIGDEIREINIALYCSEDPYPSTPLFYWSYSPQNVQCTPMLPGILGFHTEALIAEFSFDQFKQFHAVLKPTSCDYNNQAPAIQSSNVCSQKYLAQATIDLSTALPGKDIFIEVGTIDPNDINNVVDEIYIHNNAVTYSAAMTSSADYAQAVADAINAIYTSPNYHAEINSSNLNEIIIYATDNAEIDPMDLRFVFSGTASYTFTNFTTCATDLTTLIENSCTTVPIETFTEECPYNFFKVINNGNTTGLGYNLPADQFAFITDVKNFWNSAVTNIVLGNVAPTTPAINLGVTIPSGTEVSFIETMPIIVNNQQLTAFVIMNYSRSGPDHDPVYTLYAISVGINCATAGNPVLFTIYDSESTTSGGTTFLPIYPDIGAIPTPGFSGAIPYIFDDISLIDLDVDGIPDHVNFEFNSTTANCNYDINPNGNSAFVDAVTLCSSPINYQSNYPTEFIENGSLINKSCEIQNENCEICMSWSKPTINYPEVELHILTCEEEMQMYIDNQVASLLEQCYENKQDTIEKHYNDKCLNNILDELKLTYELNMGYYTLYYYDRAGNLIETVSPQGVEILKATTTPNLSDVAQYRSGSTSTPAVVDHRLNTKYKYNSIKQLIQQETPDGGTTYFWYNAAGQLVLSQNEKQRGCNMSDPHLPWFSYTKYDKLGRITEVGELLNYTSVSTTLSFSPSSLCSATFDVTDYQVIVDLWTELSFPDNLSGIVKKDVVFTEYSDPISGVNYNGQIQQNLRNRVSHTFTDDDGNTGTITDQVHSYFSYDPHGNVEWLIQELPDIGRKKMRYEYDLVSGNVNKVFYNEGTTEQLIHKYTYDGDNRILQVFTSKDGLLWDNDANYEYYLHGPLARTEIGDDKLQGVDYTYTIEGYLKAINQVELIVTGNNDPGMDGAMKTELTLIQNGVVNSINDFSITGAIVSVTINGTNVYSIAWSTNNNAVETAIELVKAINTNYNPTLGVLTKASNKGGTSNVVTIYNPTSTNTNVLVNGLVVGKMNKLGFVKDEFAMELGYYEKDFNRNNTFIGGDLLAATNSAHYPYSNTSSPQPTRELFNGNISYWTTNIRSGNDAGTGNSMGLKTNFYNYDKLNRLVYNNFMAFNGTTYENQYNSNSTLTYDEDFEYDLNGNITKLKRWGYGAYGNTTDNMFDDFTYHYPQIGGKTVQNSLNYVGDVQGTFGDDIANQTTGNYKYDEIGNLIKDISEGLDITWNVFGKVESITKTNGEVILFDYDASGNRVLKKVIDGAGLITDVTYYVRDAGGNPMAIYTKNYDGVNTAIKLQEQPIYGSSRIGEFKPDLLLASYGGYQGDLSTPPVETPFEQATTSSLIIANDLSHWIIGSKRTSSFSSNLPFIDFHVGDPVVTNTYASGTNFLTKFKSQSLGEDVKGNLKFAFDIWKASPQGFMVFNSVLQGPLGSNSLYCSSCPSTGYLKGAIWGKSIVIQAQDNENIYHIVTGANDGKLYYHTIDLTAPSTGDVIAINKSINTAAGQLTFDVNSKQYALAAYHDLDNVDPNKLYIAVKQVGTTNANSGISVFEFDFNSAGIATGNLVKKFTSSGKTPWGQIPDLNARYDLGEMQVAPNGSEVALNIYNSKYHTLERFDIDGSTASLTYNLTKQKLIEFENFPNTTNTRDGLKRAIISFDYTNSNDYTNSDNIFYVQKKRKKPNTPPISLPSGRMTSLALKIGIATHHELELNHIELTQPGVINTNLITFEDHYAYAEVRRGHNQKMYLNYLDYYEVLPHNQLAVFNFDGTQSTSLPLGTNGISKFYGLPLQPYKKKTITNTQITTYKRRVGDKLYEFNDHLGNVRAVINDKRLANINVSGASVDDYDVSIQSWNDYYAFGQLMPGRSFSSSDYRYGFNGMEKDGEIKGEGNSYDFGARIYDPRIGRWLSLDPLMKKYPDLSPYNFTRNSPILFIDKDGRDFDEAIVSKDGSASEALIALVSNLGLHDASARDANFVSTIHPPCIGCSAINLYPNIYYNDDIGESTFKSTKSQVKLAAHELSHFDELYVVQKDFGISGVSAWYIKYINESTKSDIANQQQTELKAYSYEDLIESYLEREFEGEVNYILNLFDNKELSDSERAKAINTAFAFWEQEDGKMPKTNPDGTEDNNSVNNNKKTTDIKKTKKNDDTDDKKSN